VERSNKNVLQQIFINIIEGEKHHFAGGKPSLPNNLHSYYEGISLIFGGELKHEEIS
jgi:hypothetical protein